MGLTFVGEIDLLTLETDWYYFTFHMMVITEMFDNCGAVCIIMSYNFTNKSLTLTWTVCAACFFFVWFHSVCPSIWTLSFSVCIYLVLLCSVLFSPLDGAPETSLKNERWTFAWWCFIMGQHKMCSVSFYCTFMRMNPLRNASTATLFTLCIQTCQLVRHELNQNNSKISW